MVSTFGTQCTVRKKLRINELNEGPTGNQEKKYSFFLKGILKKKNGAKNVQITESKSTPEEDDG